MPVVQAPMSSKTGCVQSEEPRAVGEISAECSARFPGNGHDPMELLEC